MDRTTPQIAGPVLTDGDLVSPTWRKLESYLERRLSEMRRMNDGEFNDPLATAVLRGQIKELKHLLALREPPVLIP